MGAKAGVVKFGISHVMKRRKRDDYLAKSGHED